MSQYRFDIDANTKKAEKNVNDLFKLLGKLDRAENKAGKIDDFANDNNVLDLLNNYKQLEGQYHDLSAAAKNYEQSSSFKGKTDDFQHFNDKLSKSSDLLKQIGSGINNLGSGGGGSFSQYVKDTDRLKTNLGDTKKQLLLLQRQATLYRRVGNQADRISTRAVDENYMSFHDLSVYKRNQAQIKKVPEVIDYNNGMLKDYQNKYDNIKEQIKSGISTEGKPITSDDLKGMHSEMRNLEKVMQKIRSNNTVLAATQETGEAADSALAAATPMIGTTAGKLAWVVALATKIGGAIGKMVSPYVKEGDKVNQKDGEQALNIGNVQGHVSDDTMRNRVQLLMRNNHLGYTTQEGLDYYGLAQQSRSFSAGHTSNDTVIGMTSALEEGGRATGIGKKSWDTAVNATMQAGGIFTDKDINRLSAVIAGENMRSGNSGATEDNAKIITSAIQQLSRTTTLNQDGISNIAATSSLMSRSSKLFSGEQGKEAIAGMNQGFQNAASFKDNALLYLKIQSDPQRFGGMNGMVNAQKELSQGLSNTSNLGMTQNFVRNAGEAQGTLFIEQHFGWDVNKANKMAKDMLDNRYTTSMLTAEARKNEKAGNDQRDKNLEAYQNSAQATYNQTNAQREASYSSVSSSTKWYKDAKNWINNGFAGIGQWAGETVNGIGKFFGDVGNSIGNFFGNGVMGTSTVHAATISKKDHNYKSKAKSKSRPKPKTKHSNSSTSSVIEQKQQAESKTKSYLNTRTQQRNLRTERNNIDRRNESLKEFARLLKEEKGGAKGIGTIGNGKISIDGSDVDDDKKKSKKKAGTKKPAGADKKVKSNSGGKSKTLKNTNNITVNVPNGITPSPRSFGDEIGTRVGEAIARQSKVWIQGD